MELRRVLLRSKKLTKVQKTTSDYITVNSEKGRSVINVKDIFYVTVSEIDIRDKMVHFIDETQLTLKNILYDKLLELLPHKQFCRISKRELIAMSCVNYYSYDEIVTKVLING